MGHIIIQNKQSQKKFEYAKNFGVFDNYNPAHGYLFQEKWIEHMKSTHACLDTYKRNEVYYYYYYYFYFIYRLNKIYGTGR